jgi:DNA-binding MarR family transcriptional regulator
MTSAIQKALHQDKPFSSIEAEVFVAIQVAANRTLDPWARYLRTTAALTPNQYNVLRILRGSSPDGLTCSQIGDRMISRDPDVTRLADRLVRRGFARRARSEGDRRVVEVSITPSGLDVLKQLDRNMPRELLGSLGEARLKALRDLLADVIAEVAGLTLPAADEPSRRAGTSPRQSNPS